MANNAQKQFFARQLHQFGDDKVQTWVFQQQKALPCTVESISGALVKVSFQVNWAPFTLPKVLMAKAQSAWSREPTQVGDKGLAVPCDIYLGGQTGLGGGVADGFYRGNLSCLIFQPVSNKNFSNLDPNIHYIIGPGGAILQTEDGTVTIKALPTGVQVIDSNGNTIKTSSSGIAVNPSGILYLGGDGVVGSYAFVTTASGPSTTVKARYA